MRLFEPPQLFSKASPRLLGRRAALMLLAFLVSATSSFAVAKDRSLDDVPPRPIREFRGAWIATVANLDWPSKPGLPSVDQQKELRAIMDKAVQLRLNVLVLQVRPACDAFYASNLEPWSEFLTGQMGQAPQPYFDPLAFAVEEAHRRGLELHAWFNPFRVREPNPKTGAATNYITRTHPAWIRPYGGQLWLDPGLKAVQDHSLRVILDVVKRYDIDGVHLDDYFYPYPVKNGAGQLLDFPDQNAWYAYVAAGGKLPRPDWRRKNIDNFIEALYHKVKAEKRWVKVGISPFGIWRLGAPQQLKKGLDAYEHLYTDSRKWLANGWADYFAPQLYWAIAGDQSYPALLDWWASQNSKDRLLCPGNDLTKVGLTWPAAEIIKQILLTRKHDKAAGNLFWNVSSLMRNSDRLSDRVGKELYGQAALVPASSWLKELSPGKPKLELGQGGNAKRWRVTWGLPENKSAWLWVYQSRSKGRWTTNILPSSQTSRTLPARGSAGFPDLVAITAVNRCAGVGPTALLRPKPAAAPAAKPKQ